MFCNSFIWYNIPKKGGDELKRVFTCKLEIHHDYHDVIKDISIHSSKFYNMTLYELKDKNYLSQNEYYHMFKDHFRCGYLQKHTYIHSIKLAMKDVKSFYALLDRYKKHPENYQKPGFPRFKHENNLPKTTFLKTAIRIRDSKLLLSVGKKVKSEQNLKHIEIELPQEVYSFVSDKNIKMITLDKCDDGRYEIKFVYEEKLIPLKKNGDIMSIDLGVTNLAAITFMNSTDQILVDGNIIKSKIATFNKYIGISQSKQMKCVGSENFVTTRKMKKLMCKRNGVVDYYIHTSSKRIVDIAESHDVKTIVIGDFKGIKSENKIKYFVQIPHTRLKKQIIYKARLRGIRVVLQEESYTSSVSAVDLEDVSEAYADKSRRVVRGLFETSYGYINSDINGSLNILRKYVGYKNIPRLIESIRDKGFREDPIRLLIA